MTEDDVPEDLFQNPLPEKELLKQSPIDYLRKYAPHLSEEAIQLWGGMFAIKQLQAEVEFYEKDPSYPPDELNKLREEYKTMYEIWFDRWARTFMGTDSDNEGK